MIKKIPEQDKYFRYVASNIEGDFSVTFKGNGGHPCSLFTNDGDLNLSLLGGGTTKLVRVGFPEPKIKTLDLSYNINTKKGVLILDKYVLELPNLDAGDNNIIAFEENGIEGHLEGQNASFDISGDMTIIPDRVFSRQYSVTDLDRAFDVSRVVMEAPDQVGFDLFIDSGSRLEPGGVNSFSGEQNSVQYLAYDDDSPGDTKIPVIFRFFYEEEGYSFNTSRKKELVIIYPSDFFANYINTEVPFDDSYRQVNFEYGNIYRGNPIDYDTEGELLLQFSDGFWAATNYGNVTGETDKLSILNYSWYSGSASGIDADYFIDNDSSGDLYDADFSTVNASPGGIVGSPNLWMIANVSSELTNTIQSKEVSSLNGYLERINSTVAFANVSSNNSGLNTVEFSGNKGFSVSGYQELGLITDLYDVTGMNSTTTSIDMGVKYKYSISDDKNNKDMSLMLVEKYDLSNLKSIFGRPIFDINYEFTNTDKNITKSGNILV